MRAVIESTAICLVSTLLVIFMSLYFRVTKRQKKLNALTADNKNNKNADILTEWAEQLQIMQAQIDLMCDLSPAFIVCLDYGRDCFSISENGQVQLGLKKEGTGQIDERRFEKLIHPDDMFIYEEVTGVENIRKAELAESPYVIKLRQADSQNYDNYLMRIKPVYGETGLSAALVLAFINTEYLEEKK